MPKAPRPVSLRLIEGQGNGTDSGGRPVVKIRKFRRVTSDPPGFLQDEARDEWLRVVPLLEAVELTKELDRASLAAYCLAYQRLVQAQRIVNVEGLLHRGSQGLSRHPAVAAVESASKELRAWAQEFGFTPSAEQRVPSRDAEGGDDNPFTG